MSNGERLLNLSGGGTKIVGIASASINLLERGYKPTIITGVSAGAYLAIPLAMGMYRQVYELLDKLTLKNMFDPAPVNEKGKFTIGAIKRAVFGEYWLGDQRRSLQLVREIITPEIFRDYKLSSGLFKLADCFVLSVDIRTGSRNLMNLKECSYDNALELILASGSIPVYTKGVSFQRELLFDGGLRNHIASVPMIEYLNNRKSAIDQIISVYARPQDNNISESADWIPADISTSLQRTIDIMTIEISKKDEEMEKLYSLIGFKLNQIFLPDIMEGTYDVDKGRLALMKAAGIEQASKVLL